MNKITCCFAGQSKLPQNEIEKIITNLNSQIEILINQGITHFISGGQMGFDLIAASLIIAKKQMGRTLHLAFVLPYHNHSSKWPKSQAKLLDNLLVEADEVVYTSQGYSKNCMEYRNKYIIERSAICLCSILTKESDTNQIISLAHKQGIRIINVATNDL